MQISKMAKKIAAISTGALMLGATLTGALAASYKLADYPAPFLKDGVLDNTVIVVGKAAATSDVVGAIDLAAALQAEAVSEEPIEGTVVDPVFSDGIKVEKSGEKFNYKKDIAVIQSRYDNEDLPDLLPEGEFEDESFTQTLTFSEGGNLTYASPGKVDSIEYDADTYLYFPDKKQVYSYALAFDSTLSYDDLADDIETKTIKIQGNTYTISDVKASATTGQWTEITLLAGDTTKWLQADEPLQVGENTITVISVNSDETVCVVAVNGASTSIDVGDTETIGGMSIGVTKAFASNTKLTDACEVNVGAQELVLQNGDTVQVNGVELDGSLVTITGNNTAETWDGFTIAYTMDKDDFEEDKYGPAQYKKAGEVWTDPVFGNWKVAFEGITSVTEDMALEADGDVATFTFTTIDGREMILPFFTPSDQVVRVGDSSGLVLYSIADQISTTATASSELKLWYVLSTGEAHLLQFDEYDDATNKFTFTEGDKTYTTSALATTLGGKESLTIGTLGSITLGYNESNDNLFYTPTVTNAETKYGATITFTNSTVVITSPNADSEVQGEDNVFTLAMTEDDSEDDTILISAPSASSGEAFIASGLDKVYKDNDVQMYMSEKGVKFEYDADGTSFVYVTYPEEDVYGNVFIAPVDAIVTSGSSGGATSKTVNPFSVGLAKLDVNAEQLTANMIVVGGPAVNLIAFEIMGKPTDPAEGFKQGSAMLKFYDRKGKAALLVAGYDAQDTVNAAYVLAQHNSNTYKSQFAELNDEVELVVTDMAKVVFSTA